MITLLYNLLLVPVDGLVLYSAHRGESPHNAVMALLRWIFIGALLALAFGGRPQEGLESTAARLLAQGLFFHGTAVLAVLAVLLWSRARRPALVFGLGSAALAVMGLGWLWL